MSLGGFPALITPLVVAAQLRICAESVARSALLEENKDPHLVMRAMRAVDNAIIMGAPAELVAPFVRSCEGDA